MASVGGLVPSCRTYFQSAWRRDSSSKAHRRKSPACARQRRTTSNWPASAGRGCSRRSAIARSVRGKVASFRSGSVSAGDIQSAALNHALIKNYSIVGLHWGLYNVRDPAAVAQCHRELTDLADRGLARPLVSERLPLEQAADGVQRLADGVTVGRVVVTP